MKILKFLPCLLTLLCTLTTTNVAAKTNKAAINNPQNIVADEGAWCWFADPRAMHYKNAAGTIDASYVGYIDVHGNIKATQYDYLTGRKSDVLIRSAFQPDDHDNPTFLVLPDERIFIIYSRHTDEACFYYRISKKAGDITDLGAEHRLATSNNTTYPSPFILSDDPDHIYLCWRGIGWHPTIAKLSMPDENDEVKFVYGPYQMVQSTGARPYAKYYSNGKDKLYFTYTTGHPDNEDPNWLYFNVVNINGTDGPQLEDIDGKKLKTISSGTFAVNKTDSYKSAYPKTVVDATSGKRDWVWQLTCDEQKNPVIAMVKISSDKNTHDYYYAHWNGTEWKKTFLANGGGRFHTSNTEYCYSGGMAIDPDNHHEVYLSCPTNGAYEIWHYTMNDNNEVVSKEQVTAYGKANNAAAMTGGNVRPFILPGSTGKPMRLMWMNGYYQYWIVKKGYELGYPTAIHAEGAWNEADNPLPEKLWSYTDGDEETPYNKIYITPTYNQFTLTMNVSLNASTYGGELYNHPFFTFGIDPTDKKPYIKRAKETYKSANKYYTSDNFATNSTGTQSDWWDTQIKSSWFTLVSTGEEVIVYRDGLIDFIAPVNLTVGPNDELPTQAAWIITENATLNSAVLWYAALTPMQIQQQLSNLDIETLGAVVPEKVVTDIVLPSKLGAKAITWTSSNPDIISETGLVNLPKTATEVTLTATINGSSTVGADLVSARQASSSKTFRALVLPRSIDQNLRASLEKLDQTKNTATGFSTNTYATLEPGLLKGLRSYTVILKANAKSLNGQPRLYDFGGGSGNSVFLRAKALSAGIKYNGGTTTMVNSPVALTTNKDYCLAVTFDAATKTTRIYIDGQEAVSGTANQSEPYMLYEAAGDARNYIGRTQWWDGSYANDNQDFIGTISNLAVYDIALTQKEICQLQGIEYTEKEYATELKNGDFEGSYTKLTNSGVSSDRAIYVPEGWTVDYATRNENDFNALKNGDLYYSQFFAPKTQNPNGGKQTMWVRQRWGESAIGFMQEVKLPEGKYTLSADVFSSDASNNSYIYLNKIQKKPTKANEWQTLVFDFEADGTEVYEIGLKTIHTNSDGERICAFDNFILTKTVPDAIQTITPPLHPSTIYNLQGQSITNPHRGLYIINGKKTIIK